MIQASSVDSGVRFNLRGLNHIVKKLILASLNQTGSTFTSANPSGLPFTGADKGDPLHTPYVYPL